MIGKTRKFSWEGLRASLSVSSFVCYLVGNHVSGTHVVRHLQAKLTTKNYGRRPSKPDRGCKFRASIEHKLTRGLSQKTVCVYAICSGLSGMSSQFCYNVTKCFWMQEDKYANEHVVLVVTGTTIPSYLLDV